MNELDLVHFVANNGIAAGVAFYVLHRLNANLERVANTLDRLERRIERLEDKILKEEHHHENIFNH